MTAPNSPEREWPYNTDPRSYVVNLLGKIPISRDFAVTPSKCVVTALQRARDNIQTTRFRQTVLEAIFHDCLANDYDDDEYREQLVQRVVRRYGRRRARQIFIERCDLLNTWRNRDARFIPDAYLIDEKNKTVVCYEVEDCHPLNVFSIGEYAAAWWNLEYIYWDLHLIAYDIYGNARTIIFPEAEFIARHVRSRRTAPPL